MHTARKGLMLKPSFHLIAHDRQIAENTASDRQRLYGNTFQRSSAGSSAIVSDPTLQ